MVGEVWCSDPKQRAEWTATLERLGPDVVRLALASRAGSSHGAMPIGAEIAMTRGFVEEWLAERLAEREAREEERQAMMLEATQASASAARASATATKVAVGIAFIAALIGVAQAYVAWVK